MQKQNDNYIFHKKSDLTKINISDIDAKLPDLKNSSESKTIIIGNWISDWIVKSLDSKKIKENYVLPSKAEFAYLLGVSIGTVQNAIRYIEDLGYVESKQCLGTLVKNQKNNVYTMRKLTSKKDYAIESIKKIILSENYKTGDILPSTRVISSKIGFSVNTTRVALETLSSYKILSHNKKSAKESGWIILTTDIKLNMENISTKSHTLVDMVVKDLENYIVENLKVGDKMPSHEALSKILSASIKTVHDGLKVLIDKGILLARRGRYGTSVIKLPAGASNHQTTEDSIFAPAKDTAFYFYEKTQNSIKKMIAQDYEIGDKLPSIKELSEKFDLSPNTIRKAFHNLADEGYLVFSRGRYGGTFVIDIPETEEQAFKWLAVNPQFAKEYNK